MAQLPLQMREWLLNRAKEYLLGTGPTISLSAIFYTGVEPDIGGLPAGTVAGTLVLSGAPGDYTVDVAGNAVTLVLDGWTLSGSIAGGQVTFFRLRKGATEVQVQGKVGLTSDPTADVKFPVTNWQPGAQVGLTHITFSMPESSG